MQDCATCHRTYSPDQRRAPAWIIRPDGHGLMCPTCQDRVRRGQPTDRQAVAR